MTKAERAHMDKVAQLACIVCKHKLGIETYPVQIHHVTVPRDHFAVAPLCEEHHKGPTGVHGLHRRGFEMMWKLSDIDLLALTNRAIAENR